MKEAIRAALQYVREAYSEERIDEVGLEEVEYDDHGGEWAVTVGFARPWDYPPVAPFEISGIKARPRATKRTYKVVRIGEDGRVRSMKNREV